MRAQPAGGGSLGMSAEESWACLSVILNSCIYIQLIRTTLHKADTNGLMKYSNSLKL